MYIEESPTSDTTESLGPVVKNTKKTKKKYSADFKESVPK
jgi:hypothetical protein